jgi:hypothetical protein
MGEKYSLIFDHFYILIHIPKVAKNLKILKTKKNKFFTIFPMGLNSQGMKKILNITHIYFLL